MSTVPRQCNEIEAGPTTVARGKTDSAPECPACGQVTHRPAFERYGRFDLYGCESCALHFWEPRTMPDARWYERLYGGRDELLLPLEPGHRYFLSDAKRPRTGDLLDIGCGTGNFLAAARAAGYEVTGTELDGNAAKFAREQLGLPRVLDQTIADFVAANSGERFDVVTFFEVLEHQAEPREFLRNVKECLRAGGCIALSVPNRERWLTGPDVLDYPPNHFLRWSPQALGAFLTGQGFEVLSMREQPAGIVHTAQMLNMALRTGMTEPAGGEASTSFRNVMQMTPEQAERVLRTKPSARQRALQILGKAKHAVCFPLAVAAWPYVRLRGYRGTYLYCLALQRRA